MKNFLSALSVLFLLTSLVCFVLTAVLTVSGKVETAPVILQVIIGVCSAAVGIVLIFLSAILSKRE
ncbi:MAG: hypothetical protein ABIH42_08605 [Planctomycetota bacterium]